MSFSSGEVASFRARRREFPLHRYEELQSADLWHSGRRTIADATLAGKWEWKGHPGVAIEPPLDWEGLCVSSRSWSLALHSWEPLAALLAAHDHLGEDSYFDLALKFAVDWLEQFPDIEETAPSPFAWYDLAVGARASRLAYLLDVVARDPARPDGVVLTLLSGLRIHAAALADDERFASHSNHGVYQLAGQMAMARRFADLPEIAAAGEQARSRLHALLASHFTDEGVHREHSPSYHHLVLDSLNALRRAGLIEDPEVSALLVRIEEALTWFITPAGRHAMFGDTNRRSVLTRLPQWVDTASLKFVLSAGRTGEPPSARTRIFAGSGYAVFRDKWPRGAEDFADCSYLAQACAFHSRVHKHADDLSFVWYDRGSDILTDAGRFGYVGKTEPDSRLFAEGFWYSDPRRVYVESTRAHNTVEVDGQSNPRRGVQPYGSALTQAGEHGEVRFSESRLCHGGPAHTRLLLFLPRSWLLVVDHLTDSTGTPHDFVQRFHLAPELDLEWIEDKTGGSFLTQLPSGNRLRAVALLSQASIEPMRGVEDPHLLGWISARDRTLDPQWAFGWEASSTPAHTFASLFCFAQERLDVVLEKNEIAIDASTGRLSWEADGELHTVGFERDVGRSFEVAHSSVRTARPPRHG